MKAFHFVLVTLLLAAISLLGRAAGDDPAKKAVDSSDIMHTLYQVSDKATIAGKLKVKVKDKITIEASFPA
jgi:hypothetical protein